MKTLLLGNQRKEKKLDEAKKNSINTILKSKYTVFLSLHFLPFTFFVFYIT